MKLPTYRRTDGCHLTVQPLTGHRIKIRIVAQINGITVSPNIIVIEFTAFDEHKAMASVKTIGGAFFESSNLDGSPDLISLSENPSKNFRADSCSLSTGYHIQVVKQKLALVVFDYDKTDQIT
jgi:hypothetical protein